MVWYKSLGLNMRKYKMSIGYLKKNHSKFIIWEILFYNYKYILLLSDVNTNLSLENKLCSQGIFLGLKDVALALKFGGKISGKTL